MSDPASRHTPARHSAFGTGIGERLVLAGLGIALIWLGVWWAIA